MGRWITGFAWLLVIGALLFTNGFLASRRAGTFNPSVTAYGASGMSVFAELLERNGYQVRIETRRSPRLAKSDFPIITVFFPEFETGPTWLDERASQTSPPPLLLQFNRFDPLDPTQFAKGTEANATLSWKSEPKRRYAISSTREYEGFNPGPFEELATVTKTETKSPFVSLEPHKRVPMVTVQDPGLFLNRSIDKHDHAAFALDLVRRLAPEGSTIVFCEHGLGNAVEPSMWQDMGPWAQASYWQVLAFLGVFVWARSVSFGAAREARITEKGAKDLVDGLGGALARGKMDHIAHLQIKGSVDQRIARALGRKGPALDPRALLATYLPEAVLHYDKAFNTFQARTNAVALQHLDQLEKLLLEKETPVRKGKTKR